MDIIDFMKYFPECNVLCHVQVHACFTILTHTPHGKHSLLHARNITHIKIHTQNPYH